MNKYPKKKHIRTSRNQRMIYINIILEHIIRYLVSRIKNKNIL
jgi:hypothetical protein